MDTNKQSWGKAWNYRSCLTLKKEFSIATGFKFQSLPKDGYATKALKHPDSTYEHKGC